MKYLKILFKIIYRLALLILALAVLYFLAAIVLTLIPVNNSFTETEKGIEIFVSSNGVHTDVVLPMRCKQMDWSNVIDTADFNPPKTSFRYIAFGRGDREFYLSTPTWADLKFTTAFTSALLPTSTAMHVTCYEYSPVPDELLKSIRINEAQYLRLAAFIRQSFQDGEEGELKKIACCNYGGVNDNFYEGSGSFHLFNTCNEWTNSALKEAGVKTAAWAPFDACVLYHLE